jgi:hypothetical protein
MITRAYLHGCEVRWHVFLVADGRLVDLRHPPFEGLFFLGAHLHLTSLSSFPPPLGPFSLPSSHSVRMPADRGGGGNQTENDPSPSQSRSSPSRSRSLPLLWSSLPCKCRRMPVPPLGQLQPCLLLRLPRPHHRRRGRQSRLRRRGKGAAVIPKRMSSHVISSGCVASTSGGRPLVSFNIFILLK